MLHRWLIVAALAVFPVMTLAGCTNSGYQNNPATGSRFEQRSGTQSAGYMHGIRTYGRMGGVSGYGNMMNGGSMHSAMMYDYNMPDVPMRTSATRSGAMQHLMLYDNNMPNVPMRSGAVQHTPMRNGYGSNRTSGAL